MENNNKFLIPGSIIIAGIIVAGAVMFGGSSTISNVKAPAVANGNPQVPTPQADISGILEVRDDDYVLGNPNAKVTIIEYGDFECPFCGRLFTDAIKNIKEQYIKSGEVKLIYRHFPLNSIHPEAQKSAEAVECAGEQDVFWEYHDLLFERQNQLSLSNYKVWATELGLDGMQFDQCLDSGKYADKIGKSFEEGRLVGVSGTPATFVNGRVVSGAVPFTTFQSIIEEALEN
jgi:protein-disulfide isomerase